MADGGGIDGGEIDGGEIDYSDDDLPLLFKRTKSNRTITNEKEAEEDRISELPDSLILHILSFLSTKEVLRTCSLSKRWEFIWTDLSEFDLWEISCNTAKIRSFVDFVGRVLAMCKGLNKFAVDFYYQKCFASDVNHWVYFVIKSKVKDITLSFRHCKESYKLPQVLYSYSSLKNLNVHSCVIAPRGIIAWGSLKRLSIHRVKLLDSVMEKILSSCPVLKVLQLKSIRGLNYLNIYSPNLTTLVIKDCNPYGETFLDISAPYLRFLSISNEVSEMRFRLKNVSAVVRAYIDLQGLCAYEISTVDHMKQIFESLQYVQMLELGPECIEIVSVLEVEGWKQPLTTQRYLTLNVWRHEMSIPGILSILRSSPNLETLLIRGSWISDEETMDVLDTYEICLEDYNMELVASHLKTVKITHFTDQDLAAEHMLTLVQILLKSAKALKKMVISVQEDPYESPSSSTSINSAKIAKRLLTFPRASPKAVVVLN